MYVRMQGGLCVICESLNTCQNKLQKMIELIVSDALKNNVPFGMYCLRCLLMLPIYWPVGTGYQNTILTR